MDDTIRTKALNTAREHWKLVLHFASWALAALIAVSVTQGHKQADGEFQARDFVDMKADVKQMHSEITQIKESQARMEGTVNAIMPWAQGVAKFQKSVELGAQEALSTPIPKGPPGHRARKP